MKLAKRIILIVLIAALAVGGLYAYSTYRTTQTAQAAAESIVTAALEKGDLALTIAATGQVRSKQTAELKWATSGQVAEVDVKVGDQVKSGQVLATLVQTSLSQDGILAQADLVSDQQALENLTITAAQARAQALSDITTYEAAVRDARYNLENFTIPSNQARLTTTEALEQAKQALDKASAAFEPYRNASQYDTTRKQLLENLSDAQAYYNAAIKRLQYEYTLEVAQANLDQAWSNYNKYQNGPDAKDVAAAQAKIAADQATLNQAMIKAPFDGIITTVSAQVGDQVSNNTAAFRLDDLSALYVDVSVSEVDIEQVQPGQAVSITFDALRDKTYQGVVTEVSQISTDTDSTVNFTVTVLVSDAGQDVHPGMTAEVNVVVASKTDTLLVPLQAVTTQDDQSIVYKVQTAGTQQAGAVPATSYQAVTVTLGISSDTYAELASGDLQAGDLVVINPDQIQGTLQDSSQAQQGSPMGILGIFGGAAGGPPPGAEAGGPPPGASSGSDGASAPSSGG